MGIFDRLFPREAPEAAPNPETPAGAEELRTALRAVRDPELDMDIVTMGLVRELRVEEKTAHVRMTLTTAGCPYGAYLVEDVERVLRELGYEPDVEVEFDPPWSPADIQR